VKLSITVAGSAFQPLYPEERALGPLLERAAALVTEGHGLGARAGAIATPLRPLLRAMNSYYTNKIEGQHTRPIDIERALHKRFDADRELARKQRLAIAHIEAEEELELALSGAPRSAYYQPSTLARIHAAIYRRLPMADRKTDVGATIAPGAWREVRVSAGGHVAPPHDQVAQYLEMWGKRYAALPGVEHAIVGASCAHHRLLWVHPFPDGNGRAARLQTHLALRGMGLTHGLWSPLRGIARDRDQYYARLSNADQPRRNDLDGRGALSEEELVKFAGWLLDVCIDQARFIGGLLGLEGLKSRIRDLLTYLAARPWRIGSEGSVVKVDALEALHYVAITGPVDRARFSAMTGLPPRTARRVLSSLLDFGVLSATSSRSAVSFAVPQSSLRFLFPRLWPEAEDAE
jgi:Fic family protein